MLSVELQLSNVSEKNIRASSRGLLHQQPPRLLESNPQQEDDEWREAPRLKQIARNCLPSLISGIPQVSIGPASVAAVAPTYHYRKTLVKLCGCCQAAHCVRIVSSAAWPADASGVDGMLLLSFIRAPTFTFCFTRVLIPFTDNTSDVHRAAALKKKQGTSR